MKNGISDYMSRWCIRILRSTICLKAQFPSLGKHTSSPL